MKNPTPQQIKSLRGSRTQEYMASLLPVNVRTWRRYEAGDTKMKQRDFDYVKQKVKELK